MNNNIVPFNNAALGCSVRTVIINNDPWFVAKDVCEALEINNTSDTLKKVLDDDEDRCIRVDGEPISYGVAVGLLEQIEQAIDEWEFDHATQCYNPEGNFDD